MKYCSIGILLSKSHRAFCFLCRLKCYLSITGQSKGRHTMNKPHNANVVESIKKQVENLISWAPDFGSIEIKITFHEGKIAKTEERRTVTVLSSTVERP